MSRFSKRLTAAGAFLALWLAPAGDAAACSACFGKSNDVMFTSYYIGAAILIGFVLSVFAGIVAFAIRMNRRAARLEQSGPGALPFSSDLPATSK